MRDNLDEFLDAPTGQESNVAFPGNYPLVENKEGTQSNVLLSTFSVDMGGKRKTFAIPTMVGGKRLSPDDAFKTAKTQGLENYPSFDTEEAAQSWINANHGKISESGQMKDPLDEFLDAPPQGGSPEVAPWKQTVSRVARPMLEAGGMVAGGILGAGGGTVLGSPGVGTAAGAATGVALGYGMAKEGADLLDIALGVSPGKPLGPETIQETARTLKHGAMYGMGGEIAPAVAIPIWRGGKVLFGKALPFAKSTFERQAGEILEAATSRGTIYAKNAEEAAALEAEIPGLKFTRGQRTGGAAEIKMERAQFRKPGAAGPMSQEQIAANDQAVRTYMERNFPGEAGIDEYIGAVREHAGSLEQITGGAERALEAKAAQLATKEPTQAGRELVGSLKTAKTQTRKAASALYDEIPKAEIPVGNLVEDAKKLVEPGVFEEPGGVHFTIQKFLDIYGKEGAPETMLFSSPETGGGLKELRTTVLNAIREENASIKPNLNKIGRLREFENSIEDTIAQLGDETKFGTNTVEKFRKASTAWKDYKATYEQGTVADVLRPGPRGEETRMAASDIAGTFWRGKPEAADDLIQAIGQGPATKAISDYANYDLLRNATNPVTGELDRGKLFRWLARNDTMLGKFGLKGKYSDLTSAMEAVQAARATHITFEKSAAARVLQADPEKAIAAAFSGEPRNTASVARELLSRVKGNPAAEQGFKKAFADHILTEAETSAKTIEQSATVSPAIFRRMMKKYGPALETVFRNEPGKMAAIKNVQKAYEIAARNKVSPLGGGSDTVELAAQIFSNIATKVASGSRTMNAARAVGQLFSRYKDRQVEAMINRAIFDPDYAQVLISISKERIPGPVTWETLGRGMTRGIKPKSE